MMPPVNRSGTSYGEVPEGDAEHRPHEDALMLPPGPLDVCRTATMRSSSTRPFGEFHRDEISPARPISACPTGEPADTVPGRSAPAPAIR